MGGYQHDVLDVVEGHGWGVVVMLSGRLEGMVKSHFHDVEWEVEICLAGEEGGVGGVAIIKHQIAEFRAANSVVVFPPVRQSSILTSH